MSLNIQKATFEQLLQRERFFCNKAYHYSLDIQSLLTQMNSRLAEVPRWKIWVWAPMGAKINEIEKRHALDCKCRLKI